MKTIEKYHQQKPSSYKSHETHIFLWLPKWNWTYKPPTCRDSEHTGAPPGHGYPSNHWPFQEGKLEVASQYSKNLILQW